MSITYFARGYAARPPSMPVPSASATHVGMIFLLNLYISPQHSAPTMLPGNAMRLPSPVRFLMTLAQNATPTPHTGPKNTAAHIFTMCCMGAHLLPATGKLIKLPATATATSTPAMASFLIEIVDFLMFFLLSITYCLTLKYIVTVQYLHCCSYIIYVFLRNMRYRIFCTE